MGEQTPIFTLASLAQAVSTRVPENFPSFGILESHIRHSAVAFQRSAQIPEFVIDLCKHNSSTQLLGHILEKLGGGSFPGFGGDLFLVAVTGFQGDVNFGVRLVLGLLEILLPKLFEEVVALNYEIG